MIRLPGMGEIDGVEYPSDETTPLKSWREKFENNGMFPMDMVAFFQTESPQYFTIDQTAEYNELGRTVYDEQGAKTGIIDVLESFVCGDNSQALLNKLKAEGIASSVCGHVFKGGEPTYNCRECGMDPTCVLCANCFKQSAHRNHKYKINTSSGGGCCDCGDIEAWKRDPHCSEHMCADVQADNTIITEGMRSRCSIVFDAILCFGVRNLDAEESQMNMNFDEDIYCTVLYNDETHTFEQVIQTLTRIVGCNQKDAIDYVSSIDREGRAAVRCGSFESCLKLKNDIDKNVIRSTLTSKPTALKVSVLHKNYLAFQHFALQLLAWVQDILTKHAVFRNVFCESITRNNECNLSHILMNDWRLWKTARTSWHHLLISGMLMEYENKKTLAISFTHYYPTLMQDFIRDDHEHSFSIVSLSVQLFTVPTIAHHLIAQKSALYKLMQTFYQEAIERSVRKKIVQFAKNTANMSIFKRAAYILFDIKYLLSFKPDAWTNDLRKNFLHGVQVLIRLLKEMQGMDSVFRQTGQHMEFEPEWEAAFNLHIKLAHIITLVLEWCGTDKVVLVKVYRMVMSSLSDSEFIISQTVNVVRELADHSASTLQYDVSSKHVSIHLPLSRFFAGLYLHLEKFDLTFDTIFSTPTHYPTPEQLIEPVLCTQTMIAQVHSGLWRRNGYSLLNQLYFYRNVKCRNEMLDRDIVVMQIGASLIESNEFLIHVLNKFDLISWAGQDFEQLTGLVNPEEDSIRHIINMVDEMLELLIVIVGERYVPGIGRVQDHDKVRKEIIQQLCIKPFSHSELSNSLPDSQNDTGIEAIIESVAVFKKSTQLNKKGVYELKPEFYDDYNMYFYHYTKEEKSKSEESHRQRRKDKKELVCCPPPKLPQLTQSFSMITNLLQCDVMLLIMQTVMKRAVDLKARSFSESHLQKVLYLIGYAVQEQETGFYPFLRFTDHAAKSDILPLIEELVSSVRVEAHRDLLIWTAKRYKEILQKTRDGNVLDMDSENELCESETHSAADIEKAEKEERSKLAAEKRAKIMAQMMSAQKMFMKTNAELFESANTSAGERNASMEWQDITTEPDNNRIECLGPNRKQPFIEKQVFTCILCSEEAEVSRTGPCMVYSCFIQKSNVLAHAIDMIPSPHIGSCGHVMHATCWKEYFNNEEQKETRRSNRNRGLGSTMADKKEFFCPLCRCINNTVLPILPPLPKFHITADADADAANTSATTSSSSMSFELWLTVMRNYNGILQDIRDVPDMADGFDVTNRFPSIDVILGDSANMDQLIEIIQPLDRALLTTELTTYIVEFIRSVRRVAPFPYASEDTEPFLVTWLACAYTIESLEMFLRTTNKPLGGQLSIRYSSCLSGLIRVCGLMGACVTNDVAAKLISHLRSLISSTVAAKNCQTSVLEWNVFRMLVSMVFVTPCVIFARNEKCSVPSGNHFEYYLLKLMFVANIAKILILRNANMDQQLATDGMDDMDDIKMPIASSRLVDFYVEHCQPSASSSSSSNQSNVKLEKTTSLLQSLEMEIRNQSESFLRCSCLLFRYMTDVEYPEEYATSNLSTFDGMCLYLGLSSDLETYFENDLIREFMIDLVHHEQVVQYKQQQTDVSNTSKSTNATSTTSTSTGTGTGTNTNETRIVQCQPAIKTLVPLPDDYSDLINSVSSFTCRNNDRDDSRNPTMCLVCGEILCSMTYCCQRELNKQSVGACTYHAYDCGAGVGIFLRIRECEILLLGYPNRGAFLSAPYVDEYGETDQGLRRGNPLRLCKDRLNKLHLLWLGHNLLEDIARVTEASNSAATLTQWLHL